MDLVQDHQDAAFKPLRQHPPKISLQHGAEGVVYISSDYPLGEMKRSVAHLLEARAAKHPERRFIAERDASGEWSYITYGEADRAASSVASALLARGMNPLRL